MKHPSERAAQAIRSQLGSEAQAPNASSVREAFFQARPGCCAAAYGGFVRNAVFRCDRVAAPRLTTSCPHSSHSNAVWTPLCSERLFGAQSRHCLREQHSSARSKTGLWLHCKPSSAGQPRFDHGSALSNLRDGTAVFSGKSSGVSLQVLLIFEDEARALGAGSP